MADLLVVGAAVAVALLLGACVRHRLGFLVEVESVSMVPTLAPGQRRLVRRQGRSRPLHRGDVVVADSAELGRLVVKRVVGLPGERVEVDAGGRVRVGSEALVEPYVVHGGGRPAAFDVPPGHVLLLGDNRARSNDARAWRAPYLPLSAVLGRVVRAASPAAGGGADPARPRCVGAPAG